MTRIRSTFLLTVALVLSLTACGGGSSSENPSAASTASFRVQSETLTLSPAAGDNPTTQAIAGAAISDTSIKGARANKPAAAQFLMQATFGPTAATIDALAATSTVSWLNKEFQKPQTLHRGTVQQSISAGAVVSPNLFVESFWKQVLSADDQLRQRVAFALSQIFVISTIDSGLYNHPAGVGSYYDVLGQYAFGNFRDLLQGVALHPMMGIYLSHMHNQKEFGERLPDENFAREIMQLMTIGLYQLNQDGTPKLSGGKPIDTYTHEDVMGLAKVFTGWSWAGPDKSNGRFFGWIVDPSRDWQPMQMYPNYHSGSDKSFLGVRTNGTGEADLKMALDTLFNHPNVGPFIGRQLIQRLVKSNPSPAYVSRVAAAFANNGAGIRGDMRAVISAILLDPEATNTTGTSAKLREPIIRLANWMRAFNARSASGRYKLGLTDDPVNSIGQTPLRAPSVFNFFRPSYTPPNTTLSAAGLAAPEMQIVGEPSVTGYLNFMLSAIQNGVGAGFDIQANYSTELSLTTQPDQLLDRINLLLLAGQMSSTLRNQIISAMNTITIPAATANNAVAVTAARRNRVHLAIFLTMASPEYLAQR